MKHLTKLDLQIITPGYRKHISLFSNVLNKTLNENLRLG